MDYYGARDFKLDSFKWLKDDTLEDADELPPPEELAERFDLWCDAVLAKAKADRRSLRGDQWKSRYNSPLAIELDGLFELPRTWRWTSFDAFAASFQYGPRFGENEYIDKGVPTVRTTDMNFRGQIVMKDPPRVKILANSRDHFLLREDDLIVTRTGATIGKCALYEASVGPAIASAYLIRYRLTRTTTLPRYLLAVLMSPWGQQQLTGGVCPALFRYFDKALAELYVMSEAEGRPSVAKRSR